MASRSGLGEAAAGRGTWSGPGSESSVSEPSWRSTTMRRAVARPRPVPCPTSLVVKNGSKTRSRTSGGIPGPSSVISTHSAVAVAARGDRDRAALAERVDRVVEQVRPHLVELGAAHGQLGQRAVVVAHDLDLGVLELVAEHRERRLQALVQVDLDELAAVHVGVGLDRADEARHRARRLLQLGGEAARRSASRRPSAARRRSPGRRPRRPGRATPRRRPAAASGSARRHGSATPSSSRRVEQLVLGVGRVERVERASRASARASASLLQLDEPLGLARARPRTRRSAPIVELITSSASASCAAGAPRRGGGVVQLVREPGRHRAERRQPLAVLLDAGDAAHHRRDLAASPAGARPAARRRARRKSSASIARRGRRSRRRMRTPSGPPVSTAIAPIQVGACWRPTGSVAARRRRAAPAPSPSSSSSRPAARSPCSAITSPGSARRRRRRPRPTRASCSSSRSSNRSTARSSAAVSARRSCLDQVLVDQRDRHRALADGAGDALDRARAHVAGDEHAGHAGLEHVRFALERPAGGLRVAARRG